MGIRMVGKSPQNKSDGCYCPSPGQMAQLLWHCCSSVTRSRPGWAAITLGLSLWLHLGPSLDSTAVFLSDSIGLSATSLSLSFSVSLGASASMSGSPWLCPGLWVTPWTTVDV